MSDKFYQLAQQAGNLDSHGVGNVIAADQAGALPLWMFIIMISASGFVLGGLTNAFGRLTNGGGGLLGFSLETPLRAVWSFLLCMFAGPYWVEARAWQFWREGDLPTAIWGMLTLLAIMWSFCSGVIILQFLYFIGVI